MPSMISKWPFASILGSGAPGIPQSLEILVGDDAVNSTVEGKPMVYKRDDPVNAELAMFIELAQDTYTALSVCCMYANALLPTVVTVSGMENPTSPLARKALLAMLVSVLWQSKYTNFNALQYENVELSIAATWLGTLNELSF